MTLPSSEARPTTAESVIRSVLLEAAPEVVWDALTDPVLLAEWLAPAVEMEPEPGGALRCTGDDGEVREGEIELVEEAERLAFSWWRDGAAAPSRVELVLDAVGERTRLTMIETGLLPAAAPVLAAGWTTALARLPRALGRLVLA